MSLLDEIKNLNEDSDVGRDRALELIEGIASADLDKAQRTLRRRVLHQLRSMGLTADDWSGRNHAQANYDSIRAALSLIDRLDRSGSLTDQQRSNLSDAVAELHRAEDAAAAVVRLA